MRLFIGVHLPESIKKCLAELQAKLQTDSAVQSFNRNFDLTLKFLGDVRPEKAEEVKKRLSALNFEKFIARLGNVGVFPDEKYVRVVWVGVEPSEKFSALQEKVEEVLKGLFEKEQRFFPHLTLSRVKSISNKDKFAVAKKIDVEKKEFLVDTVELVESRLTKEGAVHTVLIQVKA